MPQLRVFVSSTAYDLAAVREQLRNQIESLGHTPVLSEYADILYDPRSHTHKSCVQELHSCDVVILLIGSRFGSDALPEFIAELSAEALGDIDGNLSGQLEDGNVSVTQLETLTAFSLGLPVFVFAERGVLHDLRVYNANRHLPQANEIHYPSIAQPGVAAYIFNFISYVQARTAGNAVFPFSNVGDIQGQLRRQLSSFFQRLLSEDRNSSQESRRMEGITEQLEDLKTVVLSSIENSESREIARGVIRFRILNEMLGALEVPLDTIQSEDPPHWNDLLQQCGVTGLVEIVPNEEAAREYASRSRIGLRLQDESVIEIRFSYERFLAFEREWESFRGLSVGVRRVILEALGESRYSRPSVAIGRRRRIAPDEDVSVNELNALLSAPMADESLHPSSRDAGAVNPSGVGSFS